MEENSQELTPRELSSQEPTPNDLAFSPFRLKSLRSATLEGAIAREVSCEASFTRGLPAFAIVGLGDEAIKEARDRVKSALLLSAYKFPPLKITVNLSPSDLKKAGSQIDLAIALLIALQNETADFGDFFCFGELGLDGEVRANPATFALALSLARQGVLERVVTDPISAPLLAKIPGVTAYPARTLREAIMFFSGEIAICPAASAAFEARTIVLDREYFYEENFALDFADVRGQKHAKRAALIAAAGFHNILLSGAPGSGKSMIVKRLAEILPPMSLAEVLEQASLASIEEREAEFKARRPLRNPHHTATRASIFGGGSRESKMGEVALANGGVLFFDELPHFSKVILEAMREPLEDNRLLISRVNSKIIYETRFLFAAAMNPCPCGNLFSPSRECRCAPIEIARYQSRLSDPFLDRIDLFVKMNEINEEAAGDITSREMRERVFAAFKMMRSRGQNSWNAKLSESETARFCAMEADAETALSQAAARFALSQRAIDKLRRISRTIADLESRSAITKADFLEALSFRRRDEAKN